MTYFVNNITKVSTTLYFGKLKFTGNTSLNDYIDFEVPEFSNITLTQNPDNLILTSGHYLVSAALGVNNSDSISNSIDWRVENGLAIVGNVGSSTQDNKVGVDSSITLVCDTSQSPKTWWII
jgi:hypothetical protein